jgi:hypothetical protein
MNEEEIIKLVRSVYPDAIAISDKYRYDFDITDTILSNYFCIMRGGRNSSKIQKDFTLELFSNSNNWRYKRDEKYMLSTWLPSIKEAWWEVANDIRIAAEKKLCL